MNQRTPRIQITLKAEVRSIFQRLASAQGLPVATIIAEFLEETAPALQNVVRVVELAKDAVSRVGKEERDRFAIAEAEILQHQHTALAALSGVEASMLQLSFDLAGKANGKAQRPVSALPSGAALSVGDPTYTNRGVNMTTKAPKRGKTND